MSGFGSEHLGHLLSLDGRFFILHFLFFNAGYAQ
jgi:hypothetical protein